MNELEGLGLGTLVGFAVYGLYRLLRDYVRRHYL